MRGEAIAAIAFAGGLALAIIAMTPPDDVIATESFDGPSQPIGPVTTRQAQRGIDAPEWQVGDAWRVSFGGGDPVCWMVVAEAADVYQQGVTCGGGGDDEIVAANIAALGQGWIGTFTRDLEGVYGNEEIRFYDWPLTDGKTWSTEWFGATMRVTATLATVDGPAGDEPGYLLTMVTEDGDVIAEYDYVPSLGWWSQIAFPQGEYVFRIVEHERDWRDAVVYGLAETRFEQLGSIVSQPTLETFQVPEDDDLLVVRAIRAREFGAAAASAGVFTIRDPGGDDRHTEAGATDQGIVLNYGYSSLAIDYIEAEPGAWTVAQEHVGLGGAAVLIRGVALTTIDL